MRGTVLDARVLSGREASSSRSAATDFSPAEKTPVHGQTISAATYLHPRCRHETLCSRLQGLPARDVCGDAGTAPDSEDGEAQQGGAHQGAVGLPPPPPHAGKCPVAGATYSEVFMHSQPRDTTRSHVMSVQAELQPAAGRPILALDAPTPLAMQCTLSSCTTFWAVAVRVPRQRSKLGSCVSVNFRHGEVVLVLGAVSAGYEFTSARACMPARRT